MAHAWPLWQRGRKSYPGCPPHAGQGAAQQCQVHRRKVGAGLSRLAEKVAQAISRARAPALRQLWCSCPARPIRLRAATSEAVI